MSSETMVITSINTSTFLSDTINFLRDDLLNNLIDPLTSRASPGKFVMTSYPQRPVQYPIITVKDNAMSSQRMGIGSQQHYFRLEVEIRVWARNVKEKDEITQNVINQLRSTFLSGSSPKTEAGLHDFEILSVVNVDEEGENAIKSKVITAVYYVIVGG